MKRFLIISVTLLIVSASFLFFTQIGTKLFGYVGHFILCYGVLGLSGLSFLEYVNRKHKQYGNN
jgi:hypothetical protein